MAEITVQGVDELLKLFGRIGAMDILQDPMHRAVLRLQRDMADYPSAPPNSTYRRTGTLGRRWTTEVNRVGDGLEGKVGNNTEYAPFVQSELLQRKIFRRRWQTDEMVAKRNERVIISDFERAIREALD